MKWQFGVKLSIYSSESDITSNHRKIWCHTLLEVSMNKIALWKNVRADDWAAELAVIASNDIWICQLFKEICKLDNCLS